MSNTVIALFLVWLISNIIGLIILVKREEERFKDTKDILLVDIAGFIIRLTLVILLGPLAILILLFDILGED